MKTAIISGSPRPNSQSMKVAKHIMKTLQASHDEAWIYNLEDNPLPLWDVGLLNKEKKWQELLAPVKEKLSNSDALVIIAPEWHGQVTSALKNFFLIFGQKELGHKPALIVSISSGVEGVYPVSELRMSSYKNNRICYIPEHIIIRYVRTVLNDLTEDNDGSADHDIRERLQWSLNILREYAIALKQVRASGAIDTKKFLNGM